MTIDRDKTPGIYVQECFEHRATELRTGVPIFLGRTEKAPKSGAQVLMRWSQFGEQFGQRADSYLGAAVRGFFANGGQFCYVAPLADGSLQALQQGLAQITPLESIDLVCAPDIVCCAQLGRAPDAEMVKMMQRAILDHCSQLGDRFAILDALPGVGVTEVLAQRSGLSAPMGALYYPWIVIAESATTTSRLIPPCGHVAGIYARSDQTIGVHKAPANEIVHEAIDLEINLDNTDQDRLNPSGVNCIRSFQGRGIRVWGARTLSQEPIWMYINVRRIFLTAGRWMQRNMSNTIFEPNDPRLWTRIVRELNTYFKRLYEQGALKGHTMQEAFYVKCDTEINPPESCALGQTVVEIGLAPSRPNEMIVVRIIHSASGISIAGTS